MRARKLVAELLAIAGTIAWSRYESTLHKHRARVRSGSELVPSRFGQIEFAIAGTGEPLLLSHGAGGGFDQALITARPLIAAGYRVIAPSRFGYLRSASPEDPSPIKQADAFAELLDTLRIKRAVVVGVSAGALAALQFAVRYPDRCKSLVILVPAAATTPLNAQGALPEQPWFAKLILEQVIKSDLLYWFGATFLPRLMARTILGTPPALLAKTTPDDRRRLDEVLWSVLPISERTQGLANDARYTSTPQAVPVGRITAPTFVVSVEDDLYRTPVAARFIAANTPGARLRMFSTGGHLWVGHDAEVSSEVLAFLREQPELTRGGNGHALAR